MKEAPHVPTLRLVVKVPAPFRYTRDKAVPWNYTSQAIVQEPQTATEQGQKTSVNDIMETRGITRSGRCYTPINSRVKEREKSIEEGRVKITILKRKDKKVINKQVTKVEVNEFSNS